MYSARKAYESIYSVGLVQQHRQNRAFYRGFTLDFVLHGDNGGNAPKSALKTKTSRKQIFPTRLLPTRFLPIAYFKPSKPGGQ
jgi:hypothetical protein